MNPKTKVTVLGAALIVFALVVSGVQLFHVYNIYGRGSYRWYFYCAIGFVGLAGIVLAVYGLLKKEKPEQTSGVLVTDGVL